VQIRSGKTGINEEKKKKRDLIGRKTTVEATGK